MLARLVCKAYFLPRPSNHEADLPKLVLDFLSAVQNLPAARILPARTGRGTLRSDLLRLELSLKSDNFDLDRFKRQRSKRCIYLGSSLHRCHRIHPTSTTDSLVPPTNPLASQHRQLCKFLRVPQGCGLSSPRRAWRYVRRASWILRDILWRHSRT